MTVTPEMIAAARRAGPDFDDRVFIVIYEAMRSASGITDLLDALELAEGRLVMLMDADLPGSDHPVATGYVLNVVRDALAAAARQGGDVKQAPGEAPQSGPKGNAQP